MRAATLEHICICGWAPSRTAGTILPKIKAAKAEATIIEFKAAIHEGPRAGFKIRTRGPRFLLGIIINKRQAQHDLERKTVSTQALVPVWNYLHVALKFQQSSIPQFRFAS